MTDVKQRVLAERARGATLRELGRTFGFSHETARRILREAGQEAVRALEHDLHAGRALLLEVPYGTWAAGDHLDGLRLCLWCLERLRERGHDVRIETHTSKQGVAFWVRPKED